MQSIKLDLSRHTQSRFVLVGLLRGKSSLSAFDRSGHELQLIVRSAGGEGDIGHSSASINLHTCSSLSLTHSARRERVCCAITLSIQAPTATLSHSSRALYLRCEQARHSIHEICANVNLCQHQFQIKRRNF